MTTVHRSKDQLKSSQSTDEISEVTPVFVLKELVERLRREQHNVQDMLSSLGFALRSFNNLNQFLELIPLVVSRVTDADGGALIIFKPNGQVRFQQLHCQEGRQCQDIRQALEIITKQMTVNPVTKPEKSIALTSNQGEQSIALNSDALTLDDQVSQYIGSDVHLFGTSIMVKNEERGRLYVFSHDRNYQWTQMRQKLVRLVADQTGVAISNDELTNELREKERLDRELEIGAEIQKRLLPRQCPNVPGLDIAARCQTANRVGGDYYDFIPANYDQIEKDKSGKWSIVIGDVMGKGVPAGLIMTMTRGMLRAEVLNQHSPAQILQHLNRVMYVDLESSHRFVTLFYSEYDNVSKILSYSNAAHNPPLLWQAATNSLQNLDTEGMLIGLDANSEYHEAQIQLGAGDTIVYYTDGLTEAANQNGDHFEEANLHQAVQWACENYPTADDILDHILQRLQAFIGANNRTSDDVTLVVVKVQ